MTSVGHGGSGLAVCDVDCWRPFCNGGCTTTSSAVWSLLATGDDVSLSEVWPEPSTGTALSVAGVSVGSLAGSLLLSLTLSVGSLAGALLLSSTFSVGSLAGALLLSSTFSVGSIAGALLLSSTLSISSIAGVLLLSSTHSAACASVDFVFLLRASVDSALGLSSVGFSVFFVSAFFLVCRGLRVVFFSCLTGCTSAMMAVFSLFSCSIKS